MTFFQYGLEQLPIPLRIGETGHGSLSAVPFQKADAIVFFLPPRQIDSHQQDFHLHILPRPLPWRKAEPQIADSRLAPLVG